MLALLHSVCVKWQTFSQLFKRSLRYWLLLKEVIITMKEELSIRRLEINKFANEVDKMLNERENMALEGDNRYKISVVGDM